MKKTPLLLFLIVIDACRSRNIVSNKGRICEKITIPMCQGIGYNYTMFPNTLKHRTQSEARFAIRPYIPLVDWVCYKWLPKFLCSLYAPVCTNTGAVMPPCRSLCERSMQDCLPLMRSFGDDWPAQFNCSKFPQEGKDMMCIPGNSKTNALSTKPFLVASSTTKPTRGVSTRMPTRTKVAPSCQRVSSPLRNRCSRLGYAHARLPNRLGHTNQNQIIRGLDIWRLVIRRQCSPLLEDFLCRIYAPPCDDDQRKIPCRSMCRKVKKSCRRVLKALTKMKWPSSLRCSKLPRRKCYGAIYKSTSQKTKMDEKNTNVPWKDGKRYKDSCEKIATPMCQGIGYNFTMFPNMFSHRNKAEVNFEVYQYLPLLEVQCSSSLRKFLCSIYVPMCTKSDETIPPCRSLCEQSKRGCEPLMEKYGFGWPAKLNCYKFPKFGEKICVK